VRSCPPARAVRRPFVIVRAGAGFLRPARLALHPTLGWSWSRAWPSAFRGSAVALRCVWFSWLFDTPPRATGWPPNPAYELSQGFGPPQKKGLEMHPRRLARALKPADRHATPWARVSQPARQRPTRRGERQNDPATAGR